MSKTATLRRNGADAEPFWTVPVTAKYLGCNAATVRKMIADGRLTAYRLGDRIIRLRKSEIDAAMERM